MAFFGQFVVEVNHCQEMPVEGVQFHPESMLSEHGMELLGNFLSAGNKGSDRASKAS